MKMATRKKRKKKIQFVAFSCGYVESNRTSWLIYGTPFVGNPGYDTIREAVTELAIDLWSKWESERVGPSTLPCCEKYRNVDEFERCPKCGRELRDDEFDVYGFLEFVEGLHSTTCDSYGESEYFSNGTTVHRQARFWPWSLDEFRDADKEQVVWIAENAEHVLLSALLEARPDLERQADDECKAGDNWRCSDWTESFSKNKQPSYR